MERAPMEKPIRCNIHIVILGALLLFTQGKSFVGSSTSLSHANNTVTSCIASERSALIGFKEGLDDPANLLSSWRGDDCCKWKGVHCSNRNSHVIKLDLRGRGCDRKDAMTHVLGGNISTSLLGLQHLEYLNLSCNEFYGVQIPDFLGSLHKLRYIDLSRSTFSGRIPPHLGKLTKLTQLDLSYNNLYGFIDEGHLSGLESLEKLSLSNTSIAFEVKSTWIPPSNLTGYSSCGALDTTMGVFASEGPARYYGYWVQPSVEGHSGLLFPGYWMAAY